MNTNKYGVQIRNHGWEYEITVLEKIKIHTKDYVWRTPYSKFLKSKFSERKLLSKLRTGKSYHFGRDSAIVHIIDGWTSAPSYAILEQNQTPTVIYHALKKIELIFNEFSKMEKFESFMEKKNKEIEDFKLAIDFKD